MNINIVLLSRKNVKRMKAKYAEKKTHIRKLLKVVTLYEKMMDDNSHNIDELLVS